MKKVEMNGCASGTNYFTFAVLLCSFYFFCSISFGQTKGQWDFDYKMDPIFQDSLLDLRYLTKPKVVENGFIRQTADGRGFEIYNGKPMRFWAVKGGGNERKMHDAELARFARFLAKIGVNLSRYHGSICASENGSGIDDEDWKPILQTPACPDYTSGHSVISRAASVGLTHFIGDSFAFQDSIEIDFGLPIRTYNSLYAASEEAAISKLYGGIHYLPTCVNGVKQVQNVAEFILSEVNLWKSGSETSMNHKTK